MKTLKILFFFCVMAFSATASAQSYSFLTLRKAVGDEVSLKVDGLKITFANGNLVAANGEQTLSVPLAEMGHMYFSATPTSIASTSAGSSVDVRIVNGTLHASAPAGVEVKVYSTDGRLMPTSGLQPGVYVVKVGSQTLKVMAR